MSRPLTTLGLRHYITFNVSNCILVEGCELGKSGAYIPPARARKSRVACVLSSFRTSRSFSRLE